VRLASDGLPPLREVIRRHGLVARKSLGQNFLFDLISPTGLRVRQVRLTASRSSKSDRDRAG